MHRRNASAATVSLAITRMRCSSSGLGDVGRTGSGRSSRARIMYQSAARIRTTNTTRPIQRLITAPTTISANAASVSSTHRNASCSLLSGLRTGASLKEVDGRVDDDPHHVDEVPVDPCQLDAVMVVRQEMPTKGANRHEEEDRQADEHVRAVQAREREEDRREGVLVRRKADPRVLDHLREQERETHQQREHEPGLEPAPRSEEHTSELQSRQYLV